jgi:hypothetical protein
LINVLFHLNIFREIRIHPPPNQTFWLKWHPSQIVVIDLQHLHEIRNFLWYNWVTFRYSRLCSWFVILPRPRLPCHPRADISIRSHQRLDSHFSSLMMGSHHSSQRKGDPVRSWALTNNSAPNCDFPSNISCWLYLCQGNQIPFLARPWGFLGSVRQINWTSAIVSPIGTCFSESNQCSIGTNQHEFKVNAFFPINSSSIRRHIPSIHLRPCSCKSTELSETSSAISQ